MIYSQFNPVEIVTRRKDGAYPAPNKTLQESTTYPGGGCKGFDARHDPAPPVLCLYLSMAPHGFWGRGIVSRIGRLGKEEGIAGCCRFLSRSGFSTTQ